ncbi:MAG: DPP IV N-terminal domain-containing protein [Anaerolineae bacterium]
MAGALLIITQPWRTPRSFMVIEEVPAIAQESALRLMAEAGYTVVGQPIWASTESHWQAPASYRLYWVAKFGAEITEVYGADIAVNAGQQASRISHIANLSNTPASQESNLTAQGSWLAFSANVSGQFQSITCLPINSPLQPSVFALTRPASAITLDWVGDDHLAPVLQVNASLPGRTAQLEINLASHTVMPDDADLRYTPQQKGEFALIPKLVSRIRELPGVGPEKIAFLENVFFILVDQFQRILHTARTLVTLAPPVATPEQPIETIKPELTAPATLVPATAVAASSPTANTHTGSTGAPTSTAQATLTPAPSVTPLPAVTITGSALADGMRWLESVYPDPQRPYAEVDLVEIDPSLLQLHMIVGTTEPKPATGLVGSGVIPAEDWPYLVAAFNGGFAAMHGAYGMMVDHLIYLPAREGIATVAVYEDGTLRLGTWGKEIAETPDMVAFRQNCPPLIEDGKITAETGKLTLWGLSVNDEVFLYRSGLGITREGKLVYAAGRSLSAYTLARALQMAGAIYAMQLDIDEYHVAFITYTVQLDPNGNLVSVDGQKLKSDMHGFDSYFLRPWQLDFFYLTRRVQPLVEAVRSAVTMPVASTTISLLTKALPGKLAMASLRDGNWEIYTLVPGLPDTLRRLTNNPADDLYPAWSRDGQQLAFASRRDGNLEIYTLDLANDRVQRVTNLASDEWAPTWAPDGQHLAYQSDRNGQSDIFANNTAGAAEVRLTPMVGNHEAPDWSPDGSTIIFDSDYSDLGDVSAYIYLVAMNADGTNPRKLLTLVESPRFSSDGTQIAFNSRRTGRWQVFITDNNGNGLRQLTDDTFDARYPTWSPDGKWIAYAGNPSGHWEIYVTSIESGETFQVTSGSSDSLYPAWGK